MNRPDQFELPEPLRPLFAKSKKLEWITLAYLLSVVLVMYLVMGSSQAMKNAWLEDMLSMVPAISFLISSRIYDKKPNSRYPYGYHRTYGIAFLCGALALFGMGSFLILDSISTLLKVEHPTIGSKVIFGHQIWLGWIMIAALLYSSIPSIILGRKKQPLAKKLHNKILYTDADTQKADYMTAFAAMAGIIGVGLGLWWADAVAAILIAFSVLKDGFLNLKDAVEDLLNRHPVHIESGEKDELVNEIRELVFSWEWVKNTEIRFREEGQVYFGEVLVTVKTEENLIANLEDGVKILSEYHWKIHDVVIMPVERLPNNQD